MNLRGQKIIGILGYEGAEALDIVGPAEAFASARQPDNGREPSPCYDVVLLGLTRAPFRTSSGLVFEPARAIRQAPPLDTLLIPGGKGLRAPAMASRVAAWVKTKAPSVRRVVSVCTGIYGLAPTGLLDGRRVTTHWRFAPDIARRYPRLRVDPHPLFLKDGKYYTSAGVTAGIDLALALIQEDCGQRVALEVARELVLYLKRPGGQEQFSEPLQVQIQSTDRFSEVVEWILSHLHEDLSVDVLAEKAALCPRHFRRRFRKSFGRGPAEFVRDLRLNEFRRQLAASRNSIETIARAVGFADPDSLRRIFRRRYGVSPGDYRMKFHAS